MAPEELVMRTRLALIDDKDKVVCLVRCDQCRHYESSKCALGGLVDEDYGCSLFSERHTKRRGL